jgi:hypothetical protein
VNSWFMPFIARHHSDQWLSLGVEDSCQGAQLSTFMEEGIHAMVGDAERIYQFEQHVMEELRAQHVYTASVSSPTEVISSSRIGGNEEMPDSSASTETGGMVNAPSPH